MARDGSGIYSAPAGTTATSGTTIESAKYNAFVNDLVTDANTARPIVAGGTGATTAVDALAALGGQPLDAGLTSIAGLTTAADRMIYTTAADTYAVATLTAAGRALLDDADAAAQRATLGLGALATAASVTTAEIAAGTLVTALETIAANNNDTTIPTSAAAKGYVDGQAVGIGQTWQDFSGSRVASTSYQNTTGRPIQAAISARSSAGPRQIEVSSDNVTWVIVGNTSNSSESSVSGVSIVIPSGWYYRINGATNALVWAELR